MSFPPTGLSEICAVYGDARMYFDRKAEWEAKALVTSPVPEGLLVYIGQPVRRIRAHRTAMPLFLEVIEKLRAQGQKGIEYNGIYAYRAKRSDWRVLSTHSWGIAIDLCASTNHMGDPPAMDLEIVAAFEDAGFTWGGRWDRPDGMHFQLARGY